MFPRSYRCGPFLLATCLAAPLHAQIHKVAPPEKVTRAIAVYEYTGDDIAKPTAARIVPITLFINGHLEDAGVYLTRPMPMALQTGVVYSLEQAGKPEGTVNLDYARNILPPGSTADVAAIGAWYGYGAYAPLPKPKPSTLKASAKIAPIDGALPDDTDDKPHFVGKQPGQPDTGPTPSTTKNPAPADDPDRPTLHRADTSSAPTGTGTIPDDDPDRPTLRHRDPVSDQPKGKKQKQSDSAVIPMAGSLNDDPDRPTMQRGKPAGMTAAPELKTLAPDLHQIAAVSDAANREQHIFTREWETHTERAETLAKLQALAQPIVTKYETTYKLTAPDLGTTTTPGAPGSDSGTRASTSSKSSAKPVSRKTKPVPPPPAPPPTLTDEQLTPYELTYGGLPTFVYTAQSPITTGGPIYITLVAQKLPSGEFQIALSNITDASHLDRTPWLRLIDAVDPDASHRADLLFELRAQTTRQFALYRLITAHAEQQFITGTIQ